MSGKGLPLATVLAVAAVLALRTVAEEDPAMNPIEEILHADERFAPFLADPAGYRLQAVLGQIEEGEEVADLFLADLGEAVARALRGEG